MSATSSNNPLSDWMQRLNKTVSTIPLLLECDSPLHPLHIRASHVSSLGMKNELGHRDRDGQ